MVHFVGAGPGAPDLITRRGAALLADADCIIYAGSLVNPAPVSYTHLHGTSHTAKVSYTQMQSQMNALGYKNVFIGTVEGEPEEMCIRDSQPAQRRPAEERIYSSVS